MSSVRRRWRCRRRGGGDISTLEDSTAVKDVQDAFTELERTVRENKG